MTEINNSSIKDTHIYVPIDVSHTINGVPPGEDILYSTLCRGEMGTPQVKRYWTSHVLITNRAVIFTSLPEKKRPGMIIYEPWIRVGKVIKDGFILKGGGRRLTLVYAEQSESKESFKNRKKKFREVIKPIMFEGREYWRTNFPTKKERKAEVKRIYNIIESKS